VLTQEQPYPNHNGGNIVFGPDGLLYIGFGDGGSGNDPQRRADKLDTLLGKLLRIDPRQQPDAPYGVPADNPFVGVAGARPEIYSRGLRNPWRFSFDSATGDLWIGDVGQDEIEEIDHVEAATGNGRGANYGWSAYEGTKRFNKDVAADPTTVMPVHEYHHGNDGCSVTGGYVYRGAAIPALAGAYVFSDYCSGGVRVIDPTDPAKSVRIADAPKNVSGFGRDRHGELYVLSVDDGLYAIVPA
jgi:glucose/arabinose dehydrogenase